MKAYYDSDQIETDGGAFRAKMTAVDTAENAVRIARENNASEPVIKALIELFKKALNNIIDPDQLN